MPIPGYKRVSPYTWILATRPKPKPKPGGGSSSSDWSDED